MKRNAGILWIYITASIALLMAVSFASIPVLADSSNNAPDSNVLEKVLSDFTEYAEQARKDWGIPGMAISIVQGDKMIYARGFGMKKLGESDPVDENTIFQIGSTSKAFTAALVAMMIEEEKLGWKDKVIDYIPEFMMYDPWVTREFMVYDLMAQHSGMPGYAGDILSFVGFDREHIIHSIRYIEPKSSFRSEFAYMNNLFLVAGALIEKVSGKTWEENLQERILNPLQMSSTTYTREGFTGSDNVAYLHKNKNGKAVPLPMDWNFIDWVYTYGPAGGINSNAVDMAKWAAFQLNGGLYDQKQLISRKNMDYMHSPKTIIEQEGFPGRNYYDLAWVTSEIKPYPAFIWHTGGTSGIKSLIQLVPELDLGFVFLTNMCDNKLPEALAKRFLDLYLEKTPGDWSAESLREYKAGHEDKDIEKPEEPKAKPLPLDVYSGTYSSPVYGEVKLDISGQNLILTIGPKKAKFLLSPSNRDTFRLSIPDIGGDSGFVTFNINESGTADRMVIEALNDGNIGCFNRTE